MVASRKITPELKLKGQEEMKELFHLEMDITILRIKIMANDILSLEINQF